MNELLPTITERVNHSLQTSTFDPSFRCALVRPLLKKPGLDRNNLQNYRPVSNLPFISKIIEKAVSEQLNQHLVTNNLRDPFQSAYSKAHSTETALLKVHNDITLALDQGNSAVLVMLDLSAAFDTIDHAILLNRQEHHYGLAGDVKDWVVSYLGGCRQRVCIGDDKSSEDITSVLEDLHWLQIPERIKFKVLLLTYKALHGEAPNYILDLLRTYKPT